MSRLMRHEDGMVVVMTARPCLDAEDYERVKSRLIEAGRRHPRVVVDCSAVEMVTGRFISALVVAYKEVDARPGDFVLCGLAESPRQVFAITHVDQRMLFRATVAEALAEVGPVPEPIVVEGV